jgi:protoheme IX farnesyltransferase
MRDYIELTKPRITWLILMSTGIGYYFGLPGAGFGAIDWLVLFHTMLGTALIASGTAALNQWYEHEADARMRRTSHRPIPSGRVTPGRAFAFGVLLSVAGFLELWFGVNSVAALLGAFTLGSYLFVYTPLKQRSKHSTTVGAIPGAMPSLIGCAAAAGTLTVDAWVLYAILFLWQFPHFYAIAWMYREDYARAGIRMLPVVEPDGRSTARQILICETLLVLVSFIPTYLGMAGKFYLVGATILGLMFLRAGLRLSLERTGMRARQVLMASVVYLPVLYALLVLDRPGL